MLSWDLLVLFLNSSLISCSKGRSYNLYSVGYVINVVSAKKCSKPHIPSPLTVLGTGSREKSATIFFISCFGCRGHQ